MTKNFVGFFIFAALSGIALHSHAFSASDLLDKYESELSADVGFVHGFVLGIGQTLDNFDLEDQDGSSLCFDVPDNTVVTDWHKRVIPHLLRLKSQQLSKPAYYEVIRALARSYPCM